MSENGGCAKGIILLVGMFVLLGLTFTVIDVFDTRLIRLECGAHLQPKTIHSRDIHACVRADHFLTSWPFGHKLVAKK